MTGAFRTVVTLKDGSEWETVHDSPRPVPQALAGGSAAYIEFREHDGTITLVNWSEVAGMVTRPKKDDKPHAEGT